VPTLRALGALNRGEPEKALEILESTERYEMAMPSISFSGCAVTQAGAC